MAAPFPHRYGVTLAWEGHGGARLTSGSRPAIEGGAPPEFDGQDGWWSPEHLLLSSLSLCLMTTFRAVAEKARLRVAAYDCQADATLDRISAGLGFTRLELRVQIKVYEPEDVERARSLLTKAKTHCIVANALMPPVHLDATVTTVTALVALTA